MFPGNSVRKDIVNDIYLQIHNPAPVRSSVAVLCATGIHTGVTGPYNIGRTEVMKGCDVH